MVNMASDTRSARLVDVARTAGVSPSTASRVLNGGKPVSAALEQRVLTVARELGYAPNLAARALRGSRNTVALVVDDVTTASIGAIVASMESAARSSGSIVTVSASGTDTLRQLSSIRVLAALRPRAMVLTGRWVEAAELEGGLEEELEQYVAAGGHVVVIGSSGMPYPSVVVSDFANARRMGVHMASLERSSYLIVAGPQDHPALAARTAGFIDGLTASGIAREAIEVVHCGMTRESATRATADAYDAARHDALLAANDVLAFGAMSELEQRGLAIPGDVCISGVDDLPLARDVTPGLTTIALPFDEIGRAALRLATEGPDVAGARIEFTGSLVLRGSTEPAMR
jgi:LacI family transcriptional regulator